jgi:hypothetical protein
VEREEVVSSESSSKGRDEMEFLKFSLSGFGVAAREKQKPAAGQSRSGRKK